MGSRRTRPPTPPLRRYTPPRSGPPSTRSSPMCWTLRRRESTPFQRGGRDAGRRVLARPFTLVLPAASSSRISLLARAGSTLWRFARRRTKRLAPSSRLRPYPSRRPRPIDRAPVSPTTAAHVVADLDGGSIGSSTGAHAAIVSKPTIVACLSGRPQLCAQGAITREALEFGARLTHRFDQRVADSAERSANGVPLCAEGRASARRRQRVIG